MIDWRLTDDGAADTRPRAAATNNNEDSRGIVKLGFGGTKHLALRVQRRVGSFEVDQDWRSK